MKNYGILGLHWNLYNLRDRCAVVDCHRALSDLVTQGHVLPLVGERFPLAQVPEGVQRLAAGRTIGRVVYDAGVGR